MYEYQTELRCWACDPDNGHTLVPSGPEQEGIAKTLTEGVMTSMSSARQSEVKAWEEELEACEHSIMLEQSPKDNLSLEGCGKCELKENLWLCLLCGNIGCGREQFGGVRGNSHGLAHFEETGHGVSVKLGTITPEGSADVYCYICNDAKLDFHLAEHLGTFGINVFAQQKTEKSMTELQIEHNLKYDFSLTTAKGEALQPVCGPGLTGLANLGNSCYMASVLQTIFSLPSFRNRYTNASSLSHSQTCSNPLHATCLECQMLKMAHGLLSGTYSHPSTTQSRHSPESVVFQDGLKPMGFKSLIGKGHAEFSTMRQQDSEEFLGHLLSVLRREHHRTKSQDPTTAFQFGMEQKLECASCHGVKYRTDEMDVLGISVPANKKEDVEGKVVYEDVDFTKCVDNTVLGLERVDGWKCSGCGSAEGAVKQSRLATLPEVLVVHAKKFQLVNWVPTKLDVPLIIPETRTLTFMSTHLGQGVQPHEKQLPEDGGSDGAAADPVTQLDPGAIAQLEAMGFPLVRCQKALLAVKDVGGGADAAMEWLFAHMEDPDIDAPIPKAGGAGAAKGQVSEEQIAALMDMGFSKPQATKALRETSNNAERAVEWLFNHMDDPGDLDDGSAPSSSSAAPATREIPGCKTVPATYKLKAFISHKGPSVHSGHYVAHIRGPAFGQTGSGVDSMGDEDWVLFNDEKVVRADKANVDDLVRLAYLYVFERV